MQEPTLDVDDASASLGVSGRTLRRLVSAGLIGYHRTELGHLRFTAGDLDAYRARMAAMGRGVDRRKVVKP